MGKVKVMDYRIYIGEGCHDCEKVLDWVNNKGIEVDVVDADHPEGKEAPYPVFARPALFEGESLKAYGMDIVEYLKKNSA